MAYIRNLAKRLVAFDCAALGSVIHTSAHSALDPSGVRSLRRASRALPRSLTLTASSSPRLSLDVALMDGSAVSGLPDAVLDDPEVKRLVAAGVISAGAEPTPSVSAEPAQAAPSESSPTTLRPSEVVQ